MAAVSPGSFAMAELPPLAAAHYPRAVRLREGGAYGDGGGDGCVGYVRTGKLGQESSEFGQESAESGKKAKPSLLEGGGHGLKCGASPRTGARTPSEASLKRGGSPRAGSPPGQRGKPGGFGGTRRARGGEGRGEEGSEPEQQKRPEPGQEKKAVLEGGGSGPKCEALPRTGARTSTKKHSEASLKRGGASRTAPPPGQRGKLGETQGAGGGDVRREREMEALGRRASRLGELEVGESCTSTKIFKQLFDRKFPDSRAPLRPPSTPATALSDDSVMAGQRLRIFCSCPSTSQFWLWLEASAWA
jgi:hypothetical protein